MKKIALIAGMGLMPLVAVQAQQDSTLNRTVVVENLYNPTVMDASKINVLPKVEEPTVPKTNIDYATSLRPVAAWNYQAMQPIVRDWQPDAAYRGYFRAGYGNNGNVDARLCYLWDISKNDRLNVAASLNGWNGDLKNFYGDDWTSRLYNTKVGLDYKHAFKKMDLTLGGAYRSQVFNYMPNWMGSELSDPGARQHQTMGNAYVGLATTDEAMPIQFAAELGYKHFGTKYPILNREKETESYMYLKGDVWKALKEGQRVGIGVRLDNYSYSSPQAFDATAVDVNPYYTLQNDSWKVRLGAHIDWWGGEDDKVHVAPDVLVEHLLADSYVLYAKAGGGRLMSSYYELAQISPYLFDYPLRPAYMTLDAAVGLKASPANGWWFHIGGGYQIRENDVCLSSSQGEPIFFVSNFYGDTKVFYGTAELKYDYKDLLDFSLKGTYYNWKWENTAWNGGNLTDHALALKPELELEAEVGFQPINGLRMNAGYEYVKHRDTDGENPYDPLFADPVSNLYLGADYAVMKNLKVFGKINNLLNKEYVASYAYPAQGMNFLAGFSLQF